MGALDAAVRAGKALYVGVSPYSAEHNCLGAPRPRVTSTLIGASSVKQLEDNIAAARSMDFNDDELTEMDRYAVESGVDFWAEAREALAPTPRRDLAD